MAIVSVLENISSITARGILLSNFFTSSIKAPGQGLYPQVMGIWRSTNPAPCLICLMSAPHEPSLLSTAASKRFVLHRKPSLPPPHWLVGMEDLTHRREDDHLALEILRRRHQDLLGGEGAELVRDCPLHITSASFAILKLKRSDPVP